MAQDVGAPPVPAITGVTALNSTTANGKLGTVVSSERFKDDVKPMDKASEAILALRPITFHYNKELDPVGILQFGLVAEEVCLRRLHSLNGQKRHSPFTLTSVFSFQ